MTTFALAVCILTSLSGCQPFDLYSKSLQPPVPSELAPPTEKRMISMPEYRVESPDIIQLEALKLVPKPPYRVDVYDVLKIRSATFLPEHPIDDFYIVDEQGYLDLGPVYGKVYVQGTPVTEVKWAIAKKLLEVLQHPDVTAQLVRTGGTQQVNGIYLIQPNGSINLLRYGMVHVAGKTLIEVRQAVEKQLEQFFDNPQVAVNVAGFNSRKYYIVLEGSAEGEDVITLSITGRETVLDAISNIVTLKPRLSREMWISRPAPGNGGCEQILPIDYVAITRGGSTATNYQIMPGDRLFIAENPEIAFNNYLTKVTSPVYQLFGIAQLGAPTVRGFQTLGRSYNRNRRSF
jgi:polysaccharide biosynthesis/export protein